LALTSKQIEQRVAELVNLPTLPGVVSHISSMVEDKKTSAADIGDVISKDQVLSAKILRLVNSPVYGFPGRISSVTHALVLLGFNVVKGLVLSTAVFDTFSRHVHGLWEHSLGCALLSRRLGRELGMNDVEEIMVAGLLHDLGKVVLSYMLPSDYEAALEMARDKRCHIAVAEREIFTVDHARVASWLADHWHLPSRLSDSLTYHHRPERAKKSPDVTAVVHVADILARGMGYGNPGDRTMPPLSTEAYQGLSLTFDQIDKVLEEVEMEFASGADLFETQD